MTDPMGLVVIVVILAGAVGGQYWRRHRSADIPGTSILLSYYSDGADMQPLAEGHTKGGLKYSAVLINNSVVTGSGQSQNGFLYSVQLPFASSIHLLGIPKKSGAFQLDPAGSGLMEKVELEGDFDDYFSLFCESGMQAEARYVLDPKAMAFVVDFCQSNNWEIVGNELYFLQTDGMHESGDTTSTFEDIDTFVAQIRPAIARPLTPAEIQEITPYGEDFRKQLPCPVCGTAMSNTGEYFTCPEGHGVLATGKELEKLVNIPRYGEKVDDAITKREKPLVCPSCNSQMERVPYNFSQFIIDSCPKCPYRWLDAGEMKPHVTK